MKGKTLKLRVLLKEPDKCRPSASDWKQSASLLAPYMAEKLKSLSSETAPSETARHENFFFHFISPANKPTKIAFRSREARARRYTLAIVVAVSDLIANNCTGAHYATPETRFNTVDCA